MGSYLSFGNEKESLKKLIAFIKNPARFYEENQDTEEELLIFMIFLVRLSAILEIFVLWWQGESAGFIFIAVVSLILFARTIADISLAFGAAITNYFAKLIIKIDDISAAQRCVAFAYVTILIPKIFILSHFAFFLAIILNIIGISKQYRITYKKSFFVAIAFWALFLLYLLLTMLAAYSKYGWSEVKDLFYLFFID